MSKPDIRYSEVTIVLIIQKKKKFQFQYIHRVGLLSLHSSCEPDAFLVSDANNKWLPVADFLFSINSLPWLSLKIFQYSSSKLKFENAKSLMCGVCISRSWSRVCLIISRVSYKLPWIEKPATFRHVPLKAHLSKFESRKVTCFFFLYFSQIEVTASNYNIFFFGGPNSSIGFFFTWIYNCRWRN